MHGVGSGAPALGEALGGVEPVGIVEARIDAVDDVARTPAGAPSKTTSPADSPTMRSPNSIA